MWHDGKPVTSEDCIASIKRWAAKDAMGQKMMSFVDSIDQVDAKTFTIKLKEPTGLVLLGLSKPSSNVPFMMPKRVADTDPNKQIDDFTGSGPFVFVKDEWKPGDKTVYVKFDKYKPRSEPASGLAGGKVAKVDRVEWRAISDAQQAINALQKGEIDMVEQPSHDLLGHAEEGSEHRNHRVADAEGAIRVPSEPPAQAVRQSEDSPGAVVRLQPGRLPDGDQSAMRTTSSRARRCSSATRRSPRPRAPRES